jgi:FlaA1/EpsC-like NDP-sugar epimerase
MATMRLLNVNPRTFIAMGHDLIVSALVWTFTFSLRWNFELEPSTQIILLQTLPAVLAVQFSCFVYFGLYRGIWRYASVHDLKLIAAAVGVSALIIPILLLLWRYGLGVPRSLYFLNPLLLILFMCSGRLAYRWWKEKSAWPTGSQAQPVLLLGAGSAALTLIEDLGRSSSWFVVGLLDDNRNKIGRQVNGVRVLGSWDQLEQIARDCNCKNAVLATGATDQATRRRVFDLCEKAHVSLLVVPDLHELMSGRVKVSQMRHVQVDDLLGRDPVHLDMTGLRHMLAGKSVLVTGGGGSIGAELCRQIARFEPLRIIVLEMNEFAVYQIAESLHNRFPAVAVVPVLGDIKDAGRLTEVFERYRPTVVFHAAAYKHVPILEQDNAWEAVRNNALGTRTVADVAARFEVEKFVFISTDKAVNPTNVMGASKRMAEMILQYLHRLNSLPVVIVRFGNVLGSSGSVIPKFREQINRGGPITVTHPEITRYFMSIPEATQLVLQAALMGRGGETFVLDMGEPIRIVDLARTMIRLSGFTEEEIPLEFTGLRPGEKLYEELLADNEKTLATPHAKLRVSRPIEAPGTFWENRTRHWLHSPGPHDDDEVRRALAEWVPEYQPPADLAAPPAAVARALASTPVIAPVKAPSTGR